MRSSAIVLRTTAICLLVSAPALTSCWKVDPDLELSTNELTFGAGMDEAGVTVTNDSHDNALTSGVNDLEYQFKSDRAWLTVQPVTGRLREEESSTHMFSIDRSQAETGQALATVTVTSNGGDEKITVIVTNTSESCTGAPSAPSGPSPQNGAIAISLSASPSWQNGDSRCDELTATYDVYFGTVNPPPFVRNNGSSKSFDPGTLAAMTLYYWRVVAKDANGSTQSATWSFRTGMDTSCSDPPAAPSSLSPADDADEVPLDQDLSWSGGESQCPGLTASYDVYFGTSYPPPFRHNNGDDKRWDPGTLDENRTYYWRIVAKDANGSRSGGERRFTTGCGGEDLSAPCKPKPENGKNDVDPKANLEWECGESECSDEDVTYVVYLGVSSSLDEGDQLGTTTERKWDLPTLDREKTYYWKVVASIGGSSKASPVWSFGTRR